MSKTSLPPSVLASDLKWPDYKSKDKPAYDAGDHGSLTFYETKSFGWCIATLRISNGRRGNPARTYAVRVSDGAPVRVGNGPHVTQTLTVYLRQSRVKSLSRYLDLFNKGSEDAGMIRDRISSRRAQGQVMRAQGRSSWRWDV